MKKFVGLVFVFCILSWMIVPAQGESYKQGLNYEDYIYSPCELLPKDSQLKVKVGETAPDFELSAISGGTISLSQYIGKKNVVLSFVPGAWTNVCSKQWPSYNNNQTVFDEYDFILIGITVDNIPSLYAWAKAMGELWFPVLSDFWPHGKVADMYGVLRSDGTAERSIIVIDKQGIIRYIDIHNVNNLPNFSVLVGELQKIEEKRR